MKKVPLKLILIGLAGVFVVAATSIAIVALVRGETTRSIIERSACATDPSSVQCQEVKRLSDKEQSVEDACIPFLKVGAPPPAAPKCYPKTEGGEASQDPQGGQLPGATG